MMEITKDTKIVDLLDEYPQLNDQMAEMEEKIRLLRTPIGKIMLKKATIGDVSKRSGIEVSQLIKLIKSKIGC